MIVLGGGNTAMDCCRSARRLGGEDVKVVVRSGFEEMKASPWEKEDAMHEGIPILNFLVPKEVTHDRRPPDRHDVREGAAPNTTRRAGASSSRPASPTRYIECDDVLVAVGQENAFPWIERDIGIEFDAMGHARSSIRVTYRSRRMPNVFFGGDAAFGPKNIIWAVAHGHDAAVLDRRALPAATTSTVQPPRRLTSLVSQKMGIHEWTYDNDISLQRRFKVPLRDKAVALSDMRGRGRTRLRHQARARGSAALPQLRRPDGVRRRRCASNATPASTSARWIASPSPKNGEEDELRTRLARRRQT